MTTQRGIASRFASIFCAEAMMLPGGKNRRCIFVSFQADINLLRSRQVLQCSCPIPAQDVGDGASGDEQYQIDISL
jgi:hypothetical protein